MVHSVMPSDAPKRADSIPRASPQRAHRISVSLPVCTPTRETQSSQTRTLPKATIGALQMRQSEGKRVLVRSAATPPIAAWRVWLLRRTRVIARHPVTPPCWPGGPPLSRWRSFMLSLKMNLNRGTSKRSSSCADG